MPIRTTRGDALVSPTGVVIAEAEDSYLDLPKGQIAFPATAVPSSDPNTLDDYEEGTFELTVGNQTVVGAFSSTGSYVKVGRKVAIICDASGATSIAGAANTYLSALPITPVVVGFGEGGVLGLATVLGCMAHTNGNLYIMGGYSATGTVSFTVTYFI